MSFNMFKDYMIFNNIPDSPKNLLKSRLLSLNLLCYNSLRLFALDLLLECAVGLYRLVYPIVNIIIIYITYIEEGPKTCNNLLTYFCEITYSHLTTWL